jgi:hypothetical protein
MPRPAYERVPVEIWLRILQHAVASPLLPFREDGSLSPHLLDNLFLFDEHCETFNMYRDQIQATVERLRLVCQSWAKFLRSNVSEVALSDQSNHWYPSKQMPRQAKRLGFCWLEWCPCDRGDCKYYAIYPKESGRIPYYWGEEPFQPYHILFPNIRIIRITDFCLVYPRDLEGLRHLIAPSVNTGRAPSFPLSEISEKLPRLTHLNLGLKDVDAQFLFEPFNHPRLQYFSLSFHHSADQPEDDTPALAKTWILPELKTLIIDGPVSGQLDESVWELVLQYARQLIGLSLTYHTDAHSIQQ